MLGFHKEKFKCLITNVVGKTAFIYLIDKEKEESYMEIPIEDLEKNNIECKAGEKFTTILKEYKGWEKITFIPGPVLANVSLTQEEIDKLTKHYEEKYEDV